MSKHLRIVIAILITLTSFASAGTLTSASQTGSSDAFTSELNGSVVEIADTSEGEFLHEYHWIGDTGDGYVQEVIVIEYGYSEVMVAFVDGDVNPQQWNDDSFAVLPLENTNYTWVLGAEADDEQSWFLSRDSNFLDLDEHMYNEFLMDIGNGQIASVWVRAKTVDLIPTIEWAQQNVTIDGHSVFTNVDLSEIQAMLDGTSAFEPYQLEGFTSDVEYWSDTGLISANEWQNPALGHTITWDDSTPWEFPFYVDFASKYLPDEDFYELFLQRDDFSAYSWLSIHEPDGRTAEDYVERWSSEEWLEGAGRDYPALAATSTSTQAGIITEFTTVFGDEVAVIYQGLVLPDGSFLYINMYATPEKMIPAYLDFVSAVKINGEPIDQLWTQAELEEIFPNSITLTDTSTEDSQSTRSADESDSEDAQSGRSSRSSRSTASPAATDWSAMGLVSDTEWQSPNTGTSFTWNDSTWTFPSDRPDAIQIDDELNTLSLETTDGRGEANLSTDTGGIPIDVWFQYLISDDWLNSLAADGTTATVLDSYSDGTTASAIFYLEGADGEKVLIVDLWENDEGVTVITEIYATPEDIADVYTTFWDGVQANGVYYPLTWTIEDITSLEFE